MSTKPTSSKLSGSSLRDQTAFAMDGGINLGTGPRSSLLRDVRIDYGPNDVISKLFIAADAGMQQFGITLSFASFEELVAVNHANRNSWHPLNPTFDPKNGNTQPDCAFVLLGRTNNGHVVTAQAMRIFDWQKTDFRKEAESLRLLYAKPAPHPVGAGCQVTAPSAHLITGRVGYGGAIWLHPSVRGRRVVSCMSCIGRAYAYTRWQIDLAFGITSTALLATGFIQDSGFLHAEAGIAFSDSADGPKEAALFWITAEEMVEDFVSFLGKSSEVSHHGTQLRNAQ